MKVVSAAPLLPAFLFLHLNDQLLAFLEQFLDVQAPTGPRRSAEVFLRDLFQRQETVALRTVFDECRFETRLDAGYPAFIDVGFFLFP